MYLNQTTSLVLASLTIWLFVLSFLCIRLISHYNSFTKNTQKKDLVGTLNEILKNTLTNKKNLEEVNHRLDQEIEKGKKHFKRIGFKRFNPFTDTGGDQSFVLTLLDENNDGIVISSLHSRENTRIYSKRIIQGKAPNQILSKEEKEVIKQATQ